ncbi:unnamed protein product [Heterobilharzia americana]|nr:unnamed protein product [Heterobilharzia americana]
MNCELVLSLGWNNRYPEKGNHSEIALPGLTAQKSAISTIKHTLFALGKHIPQNLGNITDCQTNRTKSYMLSRYSFSNQAGQLETNEKSGASVKIIRNSNNLEPENTRHYQQTYLKLPYQCSTPNISGLTVNSYSRPQSRISKLSKVGKMKLVRGNVGSNIAASTATTTTTTITNKSGNKLSKLGAMSTKLNR